VTKIEVARATVAEAAAAFDASPDATVFHGARWAQVMAESYGHQTHVLVARDGTAIRGAFSVVRQRVWPLGEKWVALPYQFHAGAPIAGDQDVVARLVEQMVHDARQAGAKFLEVRTTFPSDALERGGLTRLGSGLQVTDLDLRSHTDTMIRRGIRREIRYAAEAGVVVEHVSATEGMQMFVAPYLREMRGLGTPQASPKFFDILAATAPDHVHISVAKRGGEVLGAILVIGDERMAYARGMFGASSARGREFFIGKALTHGAIEAARRRGVRRFHLGITWDRDEGLSAYKAGWGGETTPVLLYRSTFRGDAPQPGDYFGGFTLVRRAWQYVPQPLADVIGQQVTRWIG
jgi:hypothetical protein